MPSLALRKTILRAHRQAWCWQDEYQGLTLADIRRLEDETQRELNKRMAQFQMENLNLSIPNSNVEHDTSQTHPSTLSDDINQPLTAKRNRQMSIDNINANRPRINSFPVPPLPRDEAADDEYFDAECQFPPLRWGIIERSFSSSQCRRWLHIAYLEKSQTGHGRRADSIEHRRR